MPLKFFEDWSKSLESDKLTHFIIGLCFSCIFCIMSFIIFNDIYVAIGLIFANILGYGIEVIQSFIPNRYVEANDAWATIAGSTLGFIMFYLIGFFV